mgnify:FL=1
MKIKLQIKKEDFKNKLGIKDGISPNPLPIVLEAKKMAVEEIRSLNPVFVPETSEMVRDKLETLKDNDRLDKSAIKGIDKLEENIKSARNVKIVGGGARGFQLYVDGAKKGAVNYVNLIAGTGVALSYNQASGRNDITISATPSPVSILTPTGTVDGSNQTFVFSSAPQIIIVDGRPMQQTSSNGETNWTGTTTIVLALAPNSDIYGLGIS